MTMELKQYIMFLCHREVVVLFFWWGDLFIYMAMMYSKRYMGIPWIWVWCIIKYSLHSFKLLNKGGRPDWGKEINSYKIYQQRYHNHGNELSSGGKLIIQTEDSVGDGVRGGQIWGGSIRGI